MRIILKGKKSAPNRATAGLSADSLKSLRDKAHADGAELKRDASQIARGYKQKIEKIKDKKLRESTLADLDF